ncbi:hypothetical protein COT51_01805 [candidate division WWE3 bacterium CG08_land_8_20_14_0_20_41_15]|uniref:O-antigen ligase-related domain-containing protein n=1 Tax=candidate division WWE3 bacterium CG08_land_8_20_14_0_20_41_15 TaxID=1975086 RepID=A0A2H0X9M6_UNCKA|nr:MAG: hypothetical protein COT51_01805 [candidate division WWE3 bacterium CG08_land_8_20_14_0_20_41_15]
MKITKILLLSLVLSLTLGQIARVSVASAVLYFSDFLILILIFWSVLFFVTSSRKLYVPKVFLLVFLFCLIAFISLLFSLNRLAFGSFLVSSLYLIRFVLYAMSGLLVSNYLRIEDFKDDLLKWITLSGLLLSIFGFFQLIFLPDFSILDPSLGWDPHKNRLAATFFDPNFTGAYLVIAFVLSFGQRIKNLWVTTVLRGIILLGIFLTFSRSAWGMLGIALFTLLLFSKRKIYEKALFFLFIAFLAFASYRLIPRVQTRLTGITDPSDSARFRLISWKNTLGFVKDNPIIGVGFNTYRFAQERKGLFDITNPLGGHSGSGADSSLLLVLATTGVIGFISYISIHLFSIFRGIQEKAPPFLAISFSLLAESNFINSLFYAPILLVWFFLLGIYLFRD